ncbi:MAG: hypothetical protein WKF81_05535 [Thermomicrobiales bacterium]
MDPADRDDTPGNDEWKRVAASDTIDPRELEEHKVFGLGIPSAETRQPSYGQGVVVSLLAAAAVLVLAIIAVGEGDGSDPPVFQITDNLFWIVSAFILILAAGGSQFAERSAGKAAQAVGHPRSLNAMATAWTVPFASSFAAILLVATFHNRAMLVIGPLIVFFGTAGALLSRDLLDDADDQSGRVASTIHTLVVHGVAFLAFSAIYLNKLDSWISAPLAGFIGGILILETLERAGIAPPQRVFYSIIGGWAIAQVTVALNWWPSYGWTGGAVLLTIFYVAAGLILVRTQRHAIRGRDLAEFGTVGALALIVLAVLS